MLVSVEKNFIFIHVAKTGGQAIKEALLRYGVPRATSQWRRLLSQLPVPEGPHARIGAHTSARWARLKLPAELYDGAFKFAVVRNPFDLAVSRYAYVRGNPKHHRHTVAQGWNLEQFLRFEKRRSWWRPVDQTSMLYDRNGVLLVDKVYRFEELADAYQDVVTRLCLDDAPPLKHINASDRGHYREYYGAGERQLVADIWARDLENFGYEF